MGNVTAVLGLSVFTDLVNDTNILVIYLSLVVLFFLVGLVLGLNINTRKKISKTEKAQKKTENANNTSQTMVSGQGSSNNGQIPNTVSGTSHSRRRHHRGPSMHIL